jgi:hypothetical protein
LERSPALKATLEKIEREEMDAKLFRTIAAGEESEVFERAKTSRTGHQGCLEKSKSSTNLSHKRCMNSSNSQYSFRPSLPSSRTKTPNQAYHIPGRASHQPSKKPQTGTLKAQHPNAASVTSLRQSKNF